MIDTLKVPELRAIIARKDFPADFADLIIDTFDEMLEQACAQPLVMGIALHTRSGVIAGHDASQVRAPKSG